MKLEISKVVERAKASGYDAELEVAAILRNAGWYVDQNVYYIDKYEKKGREIDILANKPFMMVSSKPEVTVRIYLCVEVKRSADPFIFFTDQVQQFEYGSGYSVLNWKSRINSKILTYDDIELHRPLRDVPRLARTYTSFKDSKEQHLRSGILSAFKGAVNQSEICEEFYSKTSHDICFFIPVVVVDGLIFEAYFPNASTDLTASQIEAIAYVQKYMSNEYGSQSSRVNIVTKGSLSKLIQSYDIWGKSLMAAIVDKHHHYSD